jgi:hypothetical protein
MGLGAGFRLENGPSAAHSQTMDDPILTKFVGFLFSLCTAMMAALMLGYVGHYDFGLSRLDIRMLALIGAATFAVIAASLWGVEYFEKNLRKPK